MVRHDGGRGCCLSFIIAGETVLGRELMPGWPNLCERRIHDGAAIHSPHQPRRPQRQRKSTQNSPDCPPLTLQEPLCYVSYLQRMLAAMPSPLILRLLPLLALSPSLWRPAFAALHDVDAIDKQTHIYDLRPPTILPGHQDVLAPPPQQPRELDFVRAR
jgi:hypothetical protein